MKSLINYLLITIFLSSIIGCAYKPYFEKIAPIDHPYMISDEISEYLKTSTEPWRFQKSACDYSYIGDYNKMLETLDLEDNEIYNFDEAEFESFKNNYTRLDAKDYIIHQAESHQITIINEAHQNPSHRIFTTELLQELYSKGYRYLGAETLNDFDKELNNRKHPIIKSGTYTKDPQFGNLLRSALEIGFTLFPYDASGQNGKPREIEQAKNIQQQIEKDTNAKYLIHCGFDHAVEGHYPDWEKAMAGRIYEYTGINPLTINQSEFNERSEIKYENSIYQKLELTEPSVFVDSNNKSYIHSKDKTWFDIIVFHPRTNYKNGRPDWIFKNQKKKIVLNISDVVLDGPFLLMAFHQNENYIEAIPADIVECSKNSKSITLALSTGEYNLIIQNSNNEAMLGKLKVK